MNEKKIKNDSLQFMMDQQKVFQERFGHIFEGMDDIERVQFIKTHSYFIIEEIVEMLRTNPYHKPWKDYSHLTKEEIDEMWIEAREEYIDVLHFVINIGLALGLDSQTINQMYKDKNKINIRRQEDPSLGYVNK